MTSTTNNNASNRASEYVKEIRDKLMQNDLDSNLLAIENGLKSCTKRLRDLNILLQQERVTVGVKQHLLACIAQIKSARKMYKSLQIVGSGYQPTKIKKHNVTWDDLPSAFGGRIRTGVVTNLKHKELKPFLDDAYALTRRRLNNALKKDPFLKVNAVFCGEFVVKRGDEQIYELKHFTTKNVVICSNTNLENWFYDTICPTIIKKLSEFQERDSGWSLSSIINLGLNINKFEPQLGSSFIELPSALRLKHACINVKNKDEACFLWAITSALYPASVHTDRITSYPHYSKILNLKNITMPMTLKQIPRFEYQNTISVNVYILEKKKSSKLVVVPTYLSKSICDKHVNLLLIQDTYEDTNEDYSRPIRYHYVWIKDLSRLVSSQLSKMHGKKFLCSRCLHYFYSESKLNTHIVDCEKLNNCKISLPVNGNNMIQFKDFKHKEKVPFVIYADLECILKPLLNDKAAYQEHIPYSIGYYVKCSYDDTLSFYKSYTGTDCIEWFTTQLKQFSEDVETVFLCPLPMDELTPKQQADFYKATTCHICEQALGDDRVRDHNHLFSGENKNLNVTSNYRGPAHSNCNLNYQDSVVIPVIFHNLSGYDAHFIIENVAQDFEGRIDLLPVNKERYISFTKHVKNNLINFRFIDSFRFMAAGLDKLASYLTKYPNLQSEFKEINTDNFKLLTRKGVYPYEHITSINNLSETNLPPKSAFYSKLNDCDISNEEYEHAKEVWSKFNCKSMGDYSDLYLKTDVLLLADVFEAFRTTCLSVYGLDPAHSYTLPGFTWSAMLKHTKIKLELLTDVDMLLFIERGTRGGLSQVCSKRYVEANNKYMPNYDPNLPSTYLIYDDLNNQYGAAMCEFLPYGAFEWLTEPEIQALNIEDISNTSTTGYVLEVDLEYPELIHDKHSDLPFCPEHRCPPGSKLPKLMATLYNKEKYVIHYRNLKQALESGLKLIKVHRVLKFNQSPWLKCYIDLNTELRKNATNEFEKNLFKLMNNAVFGKTMENLRKHSIVKLVTKWEGRYAAEALISRPTFKSATIFNEDLVAIELNKSEIFFNKPIYIGMCILDISKLYIYNFHYNYMKSMFGGDCCLLYTDTDSLIYEVETPDLYEIIKEDALKYYDTSDYSPNNPYGIPLVNKKVLGMMKDENQGKVMTHYVGVRSKAYSVRVEGKDAIKKAKGIKRNVVKTRITFDDYVNCVFNNENLIINQSFFKSDKHKVSTVSTQKIALNSTDNKRYILSNKNDSLPWGHYSIMELE